LEQFGLRLLAAAEAGGAAAVKPQSALFERQGSAGVAVLERLLAAARDQGVLTILDVKRGDIGSTMAAYAAAYLSDASPLAADAVTLSPYLGFGSLSPALDLARQTGRGVFVLAFTSNPEGASVQQALAAGELTVGESIIEAAAQANREELAAAVAAQPELPGEPAGQVGLVGQLGRVGLVIGATIGSLPPAGRALVAQLGGPILAPGVGAQGAGPKELAELFGPACHLVLATSSRGVAQAGPELGQLVEAVRHNAAAVGFLGQR
jgi:orotidine-5'-phosphate decarboxylase